MRKRYYCPALLVLFGMIFSSPVFAATDTTVIGWTFDKSSGMQGWHAGGQLKEVHLTDAGLSALPSGQDPILTGPVFTKPLSPDQCVEIEMACEASGQAQLFWATDLSGKYGGFGEKKTLLFSCRGDGKFYTYRLYPFWHMGPELRRLRFDPPNTDRFAIRSIRIVGPSAGASEVSLQKISAQTAWQFQDGLEGWQLISGLDDQASLVCRNGRLKLISSDPRSAIISPRLAMAAEGRFYVSFRMATDAGTMGEVFVVSKQKPGSETASFRLVPDGKMHTYNVEVGTLSNWEGEILLVGIRPTDAPGTTTSRFESIAVTDDPAGPIDLQCEYFGSRDTVARVERSTTISCLLKNLGGTAAEQVTLELDCSPGIKALGGSVQAVPPILFGIPQETTWKVSAMRSGTYPLSVIVKCGGKSVLRRECKLTFTKTPRVAGTGYIPTPRPVKSEMEVGTFYFPGWPNINRWRPIFDYPNRRPAMGWYDEANPECVDWQIKWAVEHGIDFFMVDWYWNRGGQHLDHWIKKGFANAKFKKYLKWCVMWANHNAAGSHSVEDWREVTKFWIDNYFGMEEYYRIDGRPVVMIWSPWGIRRDVGGVEASAKLYAMSQRMAKEAGYKGIYFIAMFSHESKAAYETLCKEGYDAATSYHGFQDAAEKHAGRKYFDFQEIVETSPTLWEREEANSGEMAYYPAVDTGWDSRPWHKDRALVIGKRTPEKFEALCRKAKRFAEKNDSRIVMLGPWNEWGEGSYIEPYSEYGFGDLDAVRNVFCRPGVYPPNLVPEDVGRGPYELPMPQMKTAWEFESEQEVLDWNAGKIEKNFRDGTLHGKAFGGDPILSSPPILVHADQFGRLVIRMRSDQDAMGQLFWSTASTSTCEKNSVRFNVIGDNKFHEYTLDLASVPGWRGVITGLRLDPVHTHGPEFEIDYLRLEAKK